MGVSLVSATGVSALVTGVGETAVTSCTEATAAVGSGVAYK